MHVASEDIMLQGLLPSCLQDCEQRGRPNSESFR